MSRVVITGIGVVSPAGNDLDTFWSALLQGHSSIGPLDIIGKERLSVRIAAQIHDFQAQKHFNKCDLGFLDRFAQFGVVAARCAIADSGLEFNEELADSTATVIGTGVGGMCTLDEAYYRLYGKEAKRIHPLTIPRLMVNAAASHISMDLGLRGPAFAVASACASGTHAIGLAFEMVRSDRTPVAITGGTEACLTLGTLKGWEGLRVLSEDTCRPFSRSRSGLVLGEGAAIIVLESLDHAAARGAPIYAELCGFGMSADANNITVPDVRGLVRAIRAALKDGRVAEEHVDYINAHGTGTTLNDSIETQAIRTVFGSHTENLAVSSIKAVLGHCLGAAGALEAAATVLALRDGVLPPTANFEEPDPECNLDVIPNVAREKCVRFALSNSFAFGGLNAVLVFGRK